MVKQEHKGIQIQINGIRVLVLKLDNVLLATKEKYHSV